MARHRHKGRPCRFESLEDRRLLAGDVTARIVHGDLVIKGDNLSNGITITAGPTAGTVVVTGVDAGGSATNVNGASNTAVSLSGFTGDLKVSMKGGDDTVSITDLTVPGKAKLKGGDGNDKFTLDGVTVDRSLGAYLGSGDDILSMTDGEVTDKTNIKGRSGGDDVTIEHSTFSKLSVSLGRGDDTLDISGSTASVKTRLDGGPNTDTFTNGTDNSLTDLKDRRFEDGTSTTPSVTPPTLAINGPTSVNEGSLYTLSLASSGTGASTISQWTITWGDGSAAQVVTSNPTSAMHTYAEGPNNFTVSATATNPDGTFNAGNTVTVAVNNVAPSVELDEATTISENGTNTLDASYTDIGLLDPHTVTVNWGDPNNTTNSVFTVPATSTLTGTPTFTSTSGDGAVLAVTSFDATTGLVNFSVAHKYVDDGLAGDTTTPGNGTPSDTSTVTITVADDDSGSGSATTTVTVNNQAPTVGTLTASPVTENGSTTLTGSFSDPGLRDVHGLSVTWGDPNDDTDSMFLLPATIGLTVGQTITAGSDDASILTITSVDTSNGLVGFSVGHTYVDDGTAGSTTTPGNGTASDQSTITVNVADDDGGTGSNTTTVTVSNVAPVVALNPISAINENDTATLTGSYTDIGIGDVHTVTVNWGDPNTATNSIFTVPATGILTGTPTFTSTSSDGAVLTVTSFDTTTGVVNFSVQHQYFDDGLSDPGGGNFTTSDNSTITVTVDDDDTGSGSQTTTVTVNNVSATVSVNPVSDINENGTATVTGTLTDVGFFDAHLLKVVWNDPNGVDSEFFVPRTVDLTVNDQLQSGTGDGAVLTITSVDVTGKVGYSVQHQYLDDGSSPGNNTTSDSTTITVSVVDDDDFVAGEDNFSDSESSTFTVKNVAPTVALNAVPDINENATATLTGSYTDIGLLDGHSVTVNWADPNNGLASTFAVSAIQNAAGTTTLHVGDIFNSSTDSAVLTISSIDTTTGQVGFSVQHQYLDDGLSLGNNTISDTSTIGVTVADDDAQSGSSTTLVTVHNVAPAVVLDAVPGISENGVATLTGTYTDGGLLDAHTVTVNWSDPNNSLASTFAVNAIQNAAGTATLHVNDTFSSSTDSAVLTITSIDSATGKVGFSVQHQYLDDGIAPGNGTDGDTNSISVTVADDDGQSGSSSRFVAVSNVSPTVVLNSVDAIVVNDTATITGKYTDAGLLDAHTLTFSWGDTTTGATFAVNAIQNAAGTATLHVNDTFNSSTDGAVLKITSINATTGEVAFSVQHQYTSNGTMTITANVSDDDASAGSGSTTLLVNPPVV